MIYISIYSIFSNSFAELVFGSSVVQLLPAECHNIISKTKSSLNQIMQNALVLTPVLTKFSSMNRLHVYFTLSTDVRPWLTTSRQRYTFIPGLGLTLASDWLSTVKYIHASYVWRHQREVQRERDVIDDVTMAITTAVHFSCRWDTTEWHCVKTKI